MAKKVTGYIKLQIPAGKATPAPPVGPALGQHGVNIVQFTKDFNARTADKGDVLIAISTSGNSKNCGYAAITAKAMGIKVIALTGAKGGKLAEIADVTVKVPETETYKVQEYHLPVYHCLCQMLEEEFFD